MNMNVNLPIMGNIHSHVKNLKLQNDFNQKKRTGDLTRHESGPTSWIEEEVKKNAENAKMGRISSKIMSGEKLTPEEEDYLREKSPQGYQDYRRNLEEQEAFEEQVRHCKTKDEVKQLKIDKINAAMTTVKAAERAMGKGASNIAMAELAKLQGFERIITKFIESGEYEKLPTQAEVNEAEKAEKEAKEALREEIMDAGQEKSEETQPEEADVQMETEAAKPETEVVKPLADAAQPAVEAGKADAHRPSPETAQVKAQQADSSKHAAAPATARNIDKAPAADPAPATRSVEAKAAYTAVQKAEKPAPKRKLNTQA